MRTTSFEAWVQAVFDHATGQPAGAEWFWAPGFYQDWEALGLTDELTVAYLTRLFSGPEVLRSYSLPQVAQGIWFLIGEASPAQPSRALVTAGVPLEARVACVESFERFFADFVAVEAPGCADVESDPFHIACYMWWDIFPSWGGPNAGEPALHDACLNVMARTLALPSELCQLSAIHGLNHWHQHYPERVERTIDELLSRRERVSPLLRRHAMWARKGMSK